MSARRHAATAALFALLAVVHTWPLAQAPATHSRVDNADYSLNAWALAWVVHQAPRDPLRLFDANIFHPEPRTLAFSEHLVPQAVLAAPVRAVGGSAVLTYNLVLLAGFVLTAWAMAYVVTRWTGDWWAGLVAGSVLAFNTHHLLRLAHIQALQGLTSGYWLTFTAAGGAAAILVRASEWWPRRGVPLPESLQPLRLLALSGVLAALVTAPFLVPYWKARQDQGLTRSIDEAAHYSAGLLDYTTTAARVYRDTRFSRGFEAPRPVEAFFPGFAAWLLAAAGAAALLRGPRVRMLVAMGALGAFLSLGPHTAAYAWLHEHVALLQGIRAPSRFGVLVLLAVAGLAGFGTARLRAWWARPDRTRVPGTPRAWAAGLLGAALVLLVNAEAFRAPIGYTRFEGFSPVYGTVARLDDAVLAELPMYQPHAFFQNAPYMLASTTHWRPLVNGYSGFLPGSYRRLAPMMQQFPEPEALDALRAAGVTHVIVHRNRFGAGRDLLLQAMAATGQFQPVAQDESVRLFRLLPVDP